MLARAVSSALGQTVQDIDVVVVDDGCTDQTAEVMAVLQKCDDRITYLRIPSALGLSGGLQRNEAIKVAKGQYICYLDDDDVMTPWSVGERVKFLEENQELDFCWGRTLFIRNNVNHHEFDDLVTTRLVKEPKGKDTHWVYGTVLPDEFMHRAGVVGESRGVWWTSGRGEDRRLLQELITAGFSGAGVDTVCAIYGRTAPYDRRKSKAASARKLARERASADAREEPPEQISKPARTRLPSGLRARLLARSEETKKETSYGRRRRTS